MVKQKVNKLVFLHRSFRFTPAFSRLSVIRYNARIDTANQILFNSFINDEKGLLAAYDRIPYDGAGKI